MMFILILVLIVFWPIISVLFDFGIFVLRAGIVLFIIAAIATHYGWHP